MLDCKTTTVYLVRHGEVHNPSGMIYGRLPRFGLSQCGRDQACVAASLLAGEQLRAVYSSPQLRARQTAAAIAARQPLATRHVSLLLSEVRTSWQGRLPTPNARLFDFYDDARADGDETIDEIARRMSALLSRLVRRHRGDKVACVSHGDPIAIVLADHSGVPLTLEGLRAFAYPKLASVTALDFASAGERPRIRPLHRAAAAT